MSRDIDSFAHYYDEQWRRLVAALAWSLPPGIDAEDVAQDAFAAAFARWKSVKNHARPDAWLFLTAFRLAGRAKRRLAARLDRELRPEPVDDDVGLRLELREALRDIPEEQRKVVMLRLYYGLSTRETAYVLQCPEGTVKSYLSRGRERLASLLEEDGREAEHGRSR
jgi:RNA polymerase sigma-70 factor (ECF subfamily)